MPGEDLDALLADALTMVRRWEAGWGPTTAHPALSVDPGLLGGAWEEFARRMQGNFPFRGDVGTIVVTAGTTGLGAVDDVAGALELRDRYGVRVHVDAAYGGFFTLLAWPTAALSEPDDPLGGAALSDSARAALRAVAQADSFVVDSHKHGLQPYGCGAVLFADPTVGRLYKHDSPYTYSSSGALHLGEISLECSRAGAAAAALWLTLRVLPLRADTGLGPILAAGRRAARDWAMRLRASDRVRLHVEPELDIVTYFPWRPGGDASAVTAASERVLAAGMVDTDPVWLSTLKVTAADFTVRHPDIQPHLLAAAEPVSVLRSVLMKPEHEAWMPQLHQRLEALAGQAWPPG